MRCAFRNLTRHGWCRLLALFCAALVPSVAIAGGIRVALLADANVEGDAILLANLLPSHTPRALLAAAGKITLGSSPQNGAARRLSGETIAAAIQESGLSPASFLVPETVTIRRRGRPLASPEIWSAIQTFLEKHPVNSLRNLHPEDLNLDAAVAVSGDDVKLTVTRLTFDPILHLARFRLRLRSVAGVAPFDVTARIPSQATGPARPPSAKTLASPNVLNSSADGAIILVDPRQSARLHLHSADANMLLAVQPLQRGRLDETIRVRLRSSGKTLQARVVGANALDATF